MYITTNEGAYEYNIGYKQLTKLPFTIPEKDNGIIFYDKYDKVWFQEGNQALTYYDPLNRSHHRFTFPNQNAIGNFEMQDAGEQGMFFMTPGGEILLFDREKLEMTRINQLKPFSDDLPNQLSSIFCWIKMASFGWHLRAAEYTGLISPRSNSNC